MELRVLSGFQVFDGDGEPVQLSRWQRRFLSVLVLQEPASAGSDETAGRSPVVSKTTLDKFGALWQKTEGSRLRDLLPGLLPARVSERTGYWLEGSPEVDLWTYRRCVRDGHSALTHGRASEAAAAYLAADRCWPDEADCPEPFGDLPPNDMLARKGRELLRGRQELRLWWWKARCEAGEVSGTEDLLARWVQDTRRDDPELQMQLVNALLIATGHAHGETAMAARAVDLRACVPQAVLTSESLRALWMEVEQHTKPVKPVSTTPDDLPGPVKPLPLPDPNPTPPRSRRRAGKRRAVYGFVALSVAVLVGWTLVASASKDPDGPAGSGAVATAGTPPVSPIAFQREGDGRQGIYLVNGDGTGERRLTEGSDSFPVWSPDRRRVAFKRSIDGRDQLFLVTVDDGKLTRLTDTFAHESFPTWSHDGRRIAFKSNRSGDDEIWVVNVDGSSPTRLTQTKAKDSYPAWSPDGTRIAFTSDRDGDPEIYVMNADGTGERRLTTNRAADDFPHWSPDSKLIAFTSDRDGNNEVYVMAADGSGTRRLTNNPASDFGAVWSTNGQELAFESNRDGVKQIFVMGVDGSTARRVMNTPALSSFPAWGVS
jgi:Tol biopolymer transport system component